jgi:hypothetical protein
LVSDKKPRLVFFQFRYDDKLPEFLLIHKRDHVNCLSHFFDVRVIDHDCDYQQICDTYEPDLALFESGLNHPTCKRLNITNIRGNARVPRLGLHNADAFCNARSGLLSDMDHWGIETLFTITTTAAEHMPALADRIFAWPNCIDPETYRDYGAWKSIPVLFNGNTTSVYPWRHKITRLVSQRYPSLICPHPGYEPSPAATRFLFGEPYARMINASAIVPACGTVAKEVVRKHFEIPGCRACLLTERSPALEAAGFVDMENCVFADESDVLDKLEHLFKNPEDLRQITAAGYELTHSRHTQKHRDQISQWYALQTRLRSDERIVQEGPYGPLTIVCRATGRQSHHVPGGGLHLELLRDGDEALAERRYSDAQRAYVMCMNYMRWMPEPKLGLALCKLHTGDPKSALDLLNTLIMFILGGYGAVDPDPVEWAYYIIALLCLGKRKEATAAAREFPWLHHIELDRVRRLVAELDNTVATTSRSADADRQTVHRVPSRPWPAWLDGVCTMLSACGQSHLADRLRASGTLASVNDNRTDTTEDGVPRSGEDGSRAIGRSRASTVFRRRFKRRGRFAVWSRAIAHRLHSLEARFGYFLPYRLSSMKRAELYAQVRRLASQHHTRSALLLGVPDDDGITEALLAGISDAGQQPLVFGIDAGADRLRRFGKTFAGRVVCHALQDTRPDDVDQTLERFLRAIKHDHRISSWDAVIVNGSAAGGSSLLAAAMERELAGAQVVVFEGTTDSHTHEQHVHLLEDQDYESVAHNPQLRRGYAIVRRPSASRATGAKRSAGPVAARQ